MFRVLPMLITLVAGSASAQPAPSQPAPSQPGTEPTPSQPDTAGTDQPAPTEPQGAETPATPVDEQPTGYTFDGVAPERTARRDYAMEFNFRARMVSVPKSVLDAWYFDEDAENWAYIDRRPRIRGYGLGMELVIKNDTNNGIFYAEFVDSQMKAGYWDDVEEPPDHLDGDFLAPSPGVGLLNFGANYAYEAHILETADTRGRFGLSFLVGGGLGLGVLTGRIDRWGPDDDGNPAYKRYLDGLEPDEGKDLPRVFPMVDVNSGLRFNFGDRWVVRMEGGLHTLLYYGATAGVMF